MEQTDSCQKGQSLGGTGKKKVKGLTKNHISEYVIHRHRQQSGDSQKERGCGVGGGG